MSTESNVANPTIEESKEHERVISLKVIDKLIEKSGESLETFMSNLLEFANKENIVTFSVLCREYNNSKRSVGAATVEKVDKKDYIKTIIKDLLEHESSIIKGQVLKINRSRKAETVTTYNVKIQQALGEALVKVQIISMDRINILSGSLLIQSISAAKHPLFNEATAQLERMLEEELNTGEDIVVDSAEPVMLSDAGDDEFINDDDDDIPFGDKDSEEE